MQHRAFLHNMILTAVCLFMLSLTSCNSNKRVVRGDQGTEYSDSKRPSRPDIPKVTTKDKATRALLDEAYSWIGTPYKYGGNDRYGVDCSGFVMMTFKNALNIALPRVSRDQGEYCRKIDRKDLRPGDLVFFRTGSADRVSHVALYIGDGKIIHSTSSRGVIISDLNEKYWTGHYHHSGQVPQFRRLVK